jgi:hypothetical protein
MATVSTDWEVYAKKHVHGARPPGTAVAAAVVQLKTNVQATCTNRGVAYPGDAAVDTGYQVETKSSH